jgi:hypothetical protein
MSNPDAKAEYDRRKKFIEDLKQLEKEQYEDMFRILKQEEVEFSENYNGIFFDVSTLSSKVLEQLEQCVLRNKEQKNLDAQRIAELELLRPKEPKRVSH